VAVFKKWRKYPQKNVSPTAPNLIQPFDMVLEALLSDISIGEIW